MDAPRPGNPLAPVAPPCHAEPVTEIGSRQRNLPAPPHVVFGDLVSPRSAGIRPWLHLLDDETAPVVLESREPESVVWSSLWPRRPDARITFELPQGGTGGGTDLRWMLTADEPAPDDSPAGQMRKRINTLIHANLRHTYGQLFAGRGAGRHVSVHRAMLRTRPSSRSCPVRR